MSAGERPELPQEDDRVPGARVAAVMFTVVLFSIVLAVLAWLDDHLRELRLRPAHEQRAATPPHVTAPGEGRALNARKRAELESYGWSDRARGLVHIPIERAMDLVAAQSKAAP